MTAGIAVLLMATSALLREGNLTSHAVTGGQGKGKVPVSSEGSKACFKLGVPTRSKSKDVQGLGKAASTAQSRET